LGLELAALASFAGTVATAMKEFPMMVEQDGTVESIGKSKLSKGVEIRAGERVWLAYGGREPRIHFIERRWVVRLGMRLGRHGIHLPARVRRLGTRYP
jgi:hypothetical protein